VAAEMGNERVAARRCTRFEHHASRCELLPGGLGAARREVKKRKLQNKLRIERPK